MTLCHQLEAKGVTKMCRVDSPFFKNINRGVELTEDGEEYLAAVSPAFDTIAAILEPRFCPPRPQVRRPNFRSSSL